LENTYTSLLGNKNDTDLSTSNGAVQMLMGSPFSALLNVYIMCI